MKLSQKLFALQGKLKVNKDGTNPHFKSKYVTLDGLLGVLLPLLEEEKLLITNYVHDRKLITQVIDVESGEEMISEFPITQDDPQKIGSCITYGKRYNIGALFNIITEWDDDGESISGANHGIKNLDLDEYIQKMKECETTDELRTVFLESIEGRNEKEKDVLIGIKDKMKDRLENPEKYNTLPKHF